TNPRPVGTTLGACLCPPPPWPISTSGEPEGIPASGDHITPVIVSRSPVSSNSRSRTPLSTLPSPRHWISTIRNVPSLRRRERLLTGTRPANGQRSVQECDTVAEDSAFEVGREGRLRLVGRQRLARLEQGVCLGRPGDV